MPLIIKNPLLIDPSRTKTLRRAFEAEAARLARSALDHVTAAMSAPDWAGNTKKEAVTELRRRVREANRLINGDSRKFNSKRWFEEYIDRAADKGIERAFLEGRKYVVDESEEEKLGAQRFFVKEVKRQYRESIDLLKDKAKNDIDGIAEHLMTAVTREVTEILRRGGSKKEIKQAITKIYKNAISKRFKAFTSVSIIGAHAEAQLDAWEHLGHKLVGLKAEWLTAGDKRVCPRCKKNERKVFTIKAARGIIPLHIGCRCAWRLVRTKSKRKQ